METYLKPIFSNNKSFGEKATVKKEGNKKTLFSYLTKVCTIEGEKATVFNLQSATTLRHVKEFLKQNGFKAKNKSQIITDYFQEQSLFGGV